MHFFLRHDSQDVDVVIITDTLAGVTSAVALKDVATNQKVVVLSPALDFGV